MERGQCEWCRVVRAEARGGGRGQIMQGCGEELDFIVLERRATGGFSAREQMPRSSPRIPLTAVWVTDPQGQWGKRADQVEAIREFRRNDGGLVRVTAADMVGTGPP